MGGMGLRQNDLFATWGLEHNDLGPSIGHA